MRYVRGGMEQSVNSMSAIALNHAEPVRMHVLLDNVTDFTITFTGPLKKEA